MSNSIMHQPQMVEVEEAHDETSIRQHFYRFELNKQRSNSLRLLLLKYRPDSTLIFCNTRRECQDVADEYLEVGMYGGTV